MTRSRIAAALAVLALTTVARAEPPVAKPKAAPSEKANDIRRMLDLTGSGQLGVQVMEQMLPQFRKMMPKVPQKFWDDFMKEVNADELVDLVVPFYDKRLTHDEVKQVIKFYESPVGKKLTAAIPEISAESMEAGRRWGMEIGQRVQRKLKEQGYQ